MTKLVQMKRHSGFKPASSLVETPSQKVALRKAIMALFAVSFLIIICLPFSVAYAAEAATDQSSSNASQEEEASGIVSVMRSVMDAFSKIAPGLFAEEQEHIDEIAEQERIAEEERLAEEEQQRQEAEETEDARLSQEEQDRIEAEQEEQRFIESLADKIPYKGMEEKYISMTFLGEPQDSTIYDEGTPDQWVAYSWNSLNGKDDTLFIARCEDGVVTSVSKFKENTDYWPEYFGLPDRYASGEKSELAKQAENTPPDPFDYDSPEEYADNVDGWYAEHGYDDPWDAAYNYYCGNCDNW